MVQEVALQTAAEPYEEPVRDLWLRDLLDRVGATLASYGRHNAEGAVEFAPYPPGFNQAYYTGDCLKFLRELEQFGGKLCPLDHLQYLRLERFLDDQVRATSSLSHNRIPDHITTLPWSMVRDASGIGRYEFRTSRDLEDFYNQMRGFPSWVKSAISLMESGLSTDTGQPQLVMRQVLQQLQGLLSNPKRPLASVFLQPLKKVPAAVSAPWTKRYITAADEAVVAYHELLDKVEAWLPGFRGDKKIGLCYVGENESYEQLLFYTSGDPVDIGQMFRFAITQYEETWSELREIRGRLRGKLGYGDLSIPEFLNFMCYDVEPGFTTVAQIRHEHQRVNDQIEAGLGKMFERTVRTPLDIQVVRSVWSEMAFATYRPPNLERRVPGRYIVPVTKPSLYVRPNILRNGVHEAAHHWQGGGKVESPYIPRLFRERITSLMCWETWAKYAEGLIAGLGIEESLTQYVMRLRAKLLEATSLMLQIKVHWLGEPLSEVMNCYELYYGAPTAKRDITRIVAWPWWDFNYLAGLPVILDIIERARTVLGRAFSLPRCHSAIIGQGDMPPSLLNSYMNWWIKTELARPR